MTNPTFFILYVDSAAASATFYEALLGRPPVEASPTFVMFALSPGAMLGLWGRQGVAPAAQEAVSGAELAFPVEGQAVVDQTHEDWSRRGLTILLAPADMEFGRTFVAADPDGHRLRVFAPAPA